MDSIELARQHARRLYDDAVQRGRDPWFPYEFVVGIASDLGITVEPCASGAALLDGGRASFDPDPELPLILHETAGSAFDQAFLVAHEIGHAQLGDGESPQTASQIDPARTAEAAPVGMDRVVDYSRRQRREVQMDLFARELLLPRPVAVDLQVNQGQTCSDVARRLGAPFEVVAQQMLDALLLPAVPLAAVMPMADIPLNDKQRKAAAHRGTAFLLQAGPGTGKTRTLVARVEGLLDEGVDPRRILLLTFSNKAAGEMAERIAQKRPREASALGIATFHSFGLDILRRFNDRCGLPADPQLLDRTEAVELLENEFPRLGLVRYRNLYDPSQLVADMLSAVSLAKDEVISPQAYRDLSRAMRATASGPADLEAAERADEVARVYERYEALKAATGRVDFGDLVMQPVLLLERDEAVRAQLQGDYDHILVDEYQDVNRSSVRLLTALRPTGENLWVVGDARQSIYRFRGASSFNMSRFGQEDFAGADRDSLDINYRSTTEIVDAFSTFASGMSAAEGPSGLLADRGPGGLRPELITVTDGAQVTAALIDRIESCRAAGYRYRDQAVLCRGNDKLSDTGQELERAGVPVLFLGSLFERTEIKDLVAVLMLLVDKRAIGLIRTACWTEFAMKMEDIVQVFERLRGAEVQPGAWRQAAPGLTAAGQTAMTALSTALEGFDASSDPWTVLATLLLDRTRLAARIASSSLVSDQAEGIAIWQFMNFVKIQPRGKGLPIQRLADRVRRLVRLRDDRDLRQLPAAAQGIDAVRLMTIHGSKGLEFPAVHLVGVNQDSIPGGHRPAKCPPPTGMVTSGEGSSDEIARAAHHEEQECLFYVAMSRAMDRLAFYGATTKSNSHARPLSKFLDRVGGIDRRAVTPSATVPPAPDAAQVAVAFTGKPRFAAEAMALYESCGRRFFYTHLLQVGGRRRMSAFMQMHEAIREVYRVLVAQEDPSPDRFDELLAQAFVTHGLHDHGYVEDYRAIARAMLDYFLASRAGGLTEAPTTLHMAFDDHEVEVRPDDVLVRDGARTLRRVKTGHASSQDGKDVAAAAFILAARTAFPDARVELVFLADAETRALDLSTRELGNRQAKLASIFLDIRSGRFPAVTSEMTCPNCPAFFVCGAVPPGTLVKTF